MTIAEGRLSVMTPANWVPGPKQGEWTYEEYAAIPEDGHRYEVVNGVLYMAPSPTWDHQRSAFKISVCLNVCIEEAGRGKVCIAPMDVELSDKNVVQPDVLVVLNERLDWITNSRVIGAPDLVVEVVSPSTARHDLSEKLSTYARAGVPGYWIVTPSSKTLELLVLDKGSYSSLGLFFGDAVLPSQIVPDISTKVEQFFI